MLWWCLYNCLLFECYGVDDCGDGGEEELLVGISEVVVGYCGDIGVVVGGEFGCGCVGDE